MIARRIQAVCGKLTLGTRDKERLKRKKKEKIQGERKKVWERKKRKKIIPKKKKTKQNPKKQVGKMK